MKPKSRKPQDARTLKKQPEKGKIENELENEIGPRGAYGSGYVLPHLCASQRFILARRSGGTVSNHRWSVGDLRLALRET